MDGTEFKFAKHQRVKLRDNLDPSLYGGMAKVGNEGTIEGFQRDEFGLPKVFIHWDSTHWAYNQQRDCWTYQEHFDTVEESKLQGDSTPAWLRKLQDSLSVPEPPTEPDPTDVEPSDYQEMIERATEALKGSEAMAVVTIERRPHPGAPEGILVPSVFVDRKSPETEVFLGSQVASLSAQMHEKAAIALVHVLTRAGNRGDSNPD